MAELLWVNFKELKSVFRKNVSFFFGAAEERKYDKKNSVI
jgi:hypothetical protein